MLKPMITDIDALKVLDDRLKWLSAWTIHHANHVRDNEDGLKVGGHQASCASMTAIMADLYAAYRLDGSAITEGVAELLLAQ